MVLVIGLELGKTSLGKILAPTPVTFSWVTVGVLAASILVKLWMALFNRRVGGRIHSKADRHGGRQPQRCADHRRGADRRPDQPLCAGGDGRLDGPCRGAVHSVQRRGAGESTIDPCGPCARPELVKYIHERVMSYPTCWAPTT